MPLAADARTLWRLARGFSGRGPHGARLERFYAPQAEHYDAFRERMLHGRRELIERLPAPAGGRVIELGGGTGRNLDFFGERLGALAAFELVDLCPALLAVARRRAAGWPNVAVLEADVTSYQPAEPAHCVYFSYALTMIPDWRRAIDNALAMLRPGAVLGVVDFYVAEARPAPGLARHSRLARGFWPRWFRRGGVRLSAAHLPYLRAATAEVHLAEGVGRVPYLPWLAAPYYVFVGRRRGEAPLRGAWLE
ncbi:MAG: class I SAM-dependent methyltransferase [Burkholderiales bacterium]|nr:class I SAM-dependent methyltransferase [Burkholderiales bacterium]